MHGDGKTIPLNRYNHNTTCRFTFTLVSSAKRLHEMKKKWKEIYHHDGDGNGVCYCCCDYFKKKK